MQTYKLLAVLLDYPGGEIVDDLRAAVADQGGALGLVRSADSAASSISPGLPESIHSLPLA